MPSCSLCIRGRFYLAGYFLISGISTWRKGPEKNQKDGGEEPRICKSVSVMKVWKSKKRGR
jgi:hypothetical protein